MTYKKLNIHTCESYKSVSSEIIKLMDLIDIQCNVYYDNIDFHKISKTYTKEYHMIIYPYNTLIDITIPNIITEPCFILYFLENYDITDSYLHKYIEKSIHIFYTGKYHYTDELHITYLPIPIHEINEVYDYDIMYYGLIDERIDTICNDLMTNFNIHIINNIDNDNQTQIYDILSKSQILLILNDDYNIINEFVLSQAIKYNIHIIVERNDKCDNDPTYLKQYRNVIHFINKITPDCISSVKKYIRNFIVHKNNSSNFTFLKEISKHININIDFSYIYRFAEHYKYNDIYRCINDIKHDKKVFHRFNCYNCIQSIQNINIKKNVSDNHTDIIPIHESVLIEFRSYPHIEFLIINAIYKLGPLWKHSIVCGNINYMMVEEICNRNKLDVNIIHLNVSFVTRKTYCELLMSNTFWNMLSGDKILIYQEDSCIFKKNISDFIQYDYIGGPWPKTQNDNSIGVGNGGFSLRSRKKMIEIINTVDPASIELSDNTVSYMKRTHLYCIPEDIYFTKSMINNNIGIIAPWNVARLFSQETVESLAPFGGHCFWNANNKHKIIRLLTISTYNNYKDNPLSINIIKNFHNNNIISEILNTDKIFFMDDISEYFSTDSNTQHNYTKWIGYWNTIMYSDNNIEQLTKNTDFIKGFDNCIAIIVYHKEMCYYLQTYFTRFDIKIRIKYIKLPCAESPILIDTKYILNDPCDICYVGDISDDTVSIFSKLDTDMRKKLIILHNENTKRIASEIIYKKGYNIFSVTNESNRDEFVQLLNGNIVFMNIQDNRHTDKIVLFIEQKIPFFINKTKSTIEYLGEKYPLYYTNLQEFQMLLHDYSNLSSLLHSCRSYLQELDTTDMSFSHFNSEVMKLIN